MKSRYTTIDLMKAIAEINNSQAMGLRVANVYDIDNKTYLVRLTHGDVKVMILIESGNRIHLTEYDWPKNMIPSGFSMKCRKHLKGRRLASVKQLGVDRIVDMTFGYDEAAYHLIVELYDRGNIVLTDFQFTVLQLLRVRTDNDADVKFAVREKYPIDLARKQEPLMTKDKLQDLLRNAKPGENIKRSLNPHFVYGPALLEHCILKEGLSSNMKVNEALINDNEGMGKLMRAIESAESIIQSIDSRDGTAFLIQKKETRPNQKDGDAELLTYSEFHPLLYNQHKNLPHAAFPSFNKSVDEFFSKLESQKIDMKALQQEKSALKRLENVRQDHEKRIETLKEAQDGDMRKAELIEVNLPLIESAIATVNNAIANQIDWEEIDDLVKEAKERSDPVAMIIKSLQLKSNHMVVSVSDPFDEPEGENKTAKQTLVDLKIDLGLTAFANARNLHNKRRQAASKEQKTVHASKKALKSAEQKTKETLKEVQTSKLINKTRKTYWFEKFYWFISSENYLVIGGRDQQQNELIVKRYMKSGDLYVHADLHGASSVVIKNIGGGEVPPKTMNEAGTMAICYSAAWEARVVTSAWWVHQHQVSKTAPSGEYLTTGSFMIRGKKNYLPPSYLVMGFTVVFKLDECSIERHMSDRKVKNVNEQLDEMTLTEEDVEIPLAEEDELTHSDGNLENGLEGKNNNDVTENVNMAPNEDGECEKDNENDHGEVVVSEIVSQSTAENDDSSDNDVNGGLFPDTNIHLEHVKGDKYELHRAVSSTSNDDYIQLGDGVLISSVPKQSENTKQRLSAKQKRDLKKKSKGKLDATIEENTKESQPKVLTNETKVHVPLKRGAKSKQKRISEKYKDQDEEDRQLIQQMLRSNEPAKPPKKKGKVKQQQQQAYKQKKLLPVDILHDPNGGGVAREAVDDELLEEAEKENLDVVDTLTGCPMLEDVLLYAVPCCAPYNSIQNFKFKVKLTPGTGKRGKAAKTAVHSFLTSKEIQEWEKDLLKCLKDTDISRNLPGKVKVSAPHLHRGKKK